MKPENYQRYLTEVTDRIAKAETHAKSLEHARNTSEGKMQSRYDTQKEIFAMELSIQQGVLDNLNNFRGFLENLQAEGLLPRNRIEYGAEFSVDLWDAQESISNALFAPVSVNLEEVQVITRKSPIGKAIEGMVKGNTFVYKLSDKPGAKWLAGIINRID